MKRRYQTRMEVARYALALLMVTIGVTHFVWPEPLVRIVPGMLPSPRLLVYLSGAAEIALGLGLGLHATRKLAAYGLIALYLAVFPANIYMALHEIQLVEGGTIPVWAMWARLPLQAVLIALAWWVRAPRPR